MFTSRAEHRLLLREDNCEDRLLDLGRSLGLVSDGELESFQNKAKLVSECLARLDIKKIVPNEATQAKLRALGSAELRKPASLSEVLRRSEIVYTDLQVFDPDLSLVAGLGERVEIEVKYKGYIERQNDAVRQASAVEGLRIPEGFDFAAVRGFSTEEREQLIRVRPRTVGQAGRISGVNPSAIQALLIHLRSARSVVV